MSIDAKTTVLAAALLAAATPATADEEPRVVRKPLSIGALSEFGQLGKGIFNVGTGGAAQELTNEWMDHFGAFITQEAVVNERLHLSGGLGGVFQYRKPERMSADFFGTQRAEFFIGPTKAEAVYHLGDPETPWLKLGTGMFPYKYNPQAYNLGEYLFRSLPYPTITHTGGYVLVNSAAATLQGFKAGLDLGSFKADLLFTTETNLAPFYDWSLGLVANYSVAGGLLELGGGVNFKRLIKINPSRTAREVDQNGYFSHAGKDYALGTDYYSRARDWYKKNRPNDTVTLNDYQEILDTVNAVKTRLAFKAAGVDTTEDGQKVPLPPDIHYYTSAGTLLMARAAFDPKKLFEAGVFGPEDLKIYVEAALLGVKDYPVFYQKKSERLPIMAGINLPGFKVLDLIAVQVEQIKSPWLNNTSAIGKSGINVPHFPTENDALLSEAAWNDVATKDDLKWSILLRKTVARSITFSGQVASDHMKHVTSNYFYGPQLDHNEVTIKSDHWYWTFQVGWGI